MTIPSEGLVMERSRWAVAAGSRAGSNSLMTGIVCAAARCSRVGQRTVERGLLKSDNAHYRIGQGPTAVVAMDAPHCCPATRNPTARARSAISGSCPTRNCAREGIPNHSRNVRQPIIRSQLFLPNDVLLDQIPDKLSNDCRTDLPCKLRRLCAISSKATTAQGGTRTLLSLSLHHERSVLNHWHGNLLPLVDFTANTLRRI